MSPESVPPCRKSTERDGPVLPATRWVSLTFLFILVFAVAVL